MEEFWDDQRFIFGTPDSLPMPNPKVDLSHCGREQQRLPKIKVINSSKSMDLGTKESSHNEKRRMAGQKSREKKKTYVMTLEENVKSLSSQIQKHDREIHQCKHKLVEALKTSHNHINQHTYTFVELERNALAEDPNLDRINLLIDIIRNRIGANGKERQANLNYAFKQTINCIFPAMYRYILNTAEEQSDIFAPNTSAVDLVSNPVNWAHELFINLQISDQQIRQLNEMKEQFREIRTETTSHVKRLNEVKEAIKNQGEAFQQKLAILRSQVNPIQCALMTIFGERNKLRREFTFSEQFQDFDKTHKIIKKQ